MDVQIGQRVYTLDTQTDPSNLSLTRSLATFPGLEFWRRRRRRAQQVSYCCPPPRQQEGARAVVPGVRTSFATSALARRCPSLMKSSCSEG
jgi:hypothetical protein